MAITKIAQINVDASAPTIITFSSIPGTFTDLLLMTSLRRVDGANGYANADLQLNGTIASSGKTLQGYNATATSNGSGVPVYTNNSGTTANTFNNASFYIPNYTSTINKSVSADLVMENNEGVIYLDVISAGLFAVTSAVTSISINLGFGFAQYSSATLYGITKGSSGGVTVA